MTKTDQISQMQTDTRKRSGLLIFWLIFMALLYALLVGVFVLSRDSSPAGTWAIPLLVVLAVIIIGALVALWFWRKAGFYVFAVASVFVAILNLALGVQLLVALFPIYSIGTTWTVLRPHWQYFH